MDEQCGVAVLLKRMNDHGDIFFRPSVRVQVTLNGHDQPIPALLIDSSVWVGVRTLCEVMGQTVTKVGGDPFSVTVTVPGRPDQTVAAILIGSTGFVKIREIAPFYDLHLGFDMPSRTLATTRV